MYLGLLLVTVVLFAVVCVYYAHHRACSWFHPLTIYLAFHGLVFVIRPLLAYYYHFSAIYDVFQFWPDAQAKNLALIVANLGMVTFAVTSLHFGSDAFVNRFDGCTAREAVAMARPLMVLTLLLLPLIGVSLWTTWAWRSWGFEASELDMATGTSINTNGGNGYIQSVQLMAVVLVSLFAWIGRFRFWSLMPLAVFGVLRAAMGGRGPLIATLVCLSCFYLYSARRKFPDWRVSMLVVAAIMLFNFVGADRGQRIRQFFGSAETAEQNDGGRALAPMEGMDAGNLEFLEYLTDKVPRRTGTYEYFVNNLQLLTEPIPRVLWKNKPIGQPIRFFNLFDYGFPIGMTRSLPGEGWTQMGLLGVVIWCGLWGAGLGWAYSAYVRSRQSVVQTALYFATMAMLVVGFRDGQLMTLFKQGLFFLTPPLLLHWLANAMGTPRAADFRRVGRQGPQRRSHAEAAIALDPPAGTGLPALAPESALPPRSRRHGHDAKARLPRGTA